MKKAIQDYIKENKDILLSEIDTYYNDFKYEKLKYHQKIVKINNVFVILKYDNELNKYVEASYADGGLICDNIGASWVEPKRINIEL